MSDPYGHFASRRDQARRDVYFGLYAIAAIFAIGLVTAAVWSALA